MTLILPDGFTPDKPYPRTKRLAFKMRVAVVWSRAHADDHSRRVRLMVDNFFKKNINRWRNCLRIDADS